jgi:hypothetical protein
MPNTTNFGWATPADTDLVKDGAAAIRTLGSSIDTSLVDLKGGTTDQVLAKNSGTDLDFKWVTSDDANAIQNSIIDAKGDLIAGSAADTPAILPVGANGTILTANSGESTGLKWTLPAGTWTQRLAPLGSFADFRVNAIATDGTAFVAVGEDGYLYESSNGTTWTSRTSGFGANDIDSVAYGNALWVAVGQNGTISTSTDRVTWTTRTSNMSTNNINYVAYINSSWVAVGAGGGTTNTGGVTYSSNGTTWTRVNQSLTVGATYNSVIFNGTNFIVGGNTSTNNYIYSATLAGSWTAASYAGSTTIEALYYDGTRTIIAGGTVVRYTTGTDLSSTTLVSNFAISSGDNHNELYLYSGRMTYMKTFISSISTTPAVAGFWNDTATAQFGPGTIGSGPTAENNCIWAGSQGLIVGGTYGQIYTNF